MNSFRITAIALLTGAIVTGCAPKPETKEARQVLTPFNIQPYQMGTCNAPGHNIPVAKIEITDLNPKNIGHNSKWYDSDKNGTADAGSVTGSISETQLGTNHDTRLDFDARSQMQTYDRILIEIDISNDKTLEFYPDILAVYAGSSTSKNYLCQLPSVTAPTPSTSMMSFYVLRAPKGSGPVSYGVALIVKDNNGGKAYRTAVIVDPGVQNEG